ncbi:hypothetical protein GUITHDRAFT_138226 [Guillardia theta CCMP2712]|uniref:Uncharacterized protein n=1 Tax=Guillardia theta (strain CCMP2712) TaxID=905079 RepID=L1JD78_GUITC|nr:hypothetical protein GUITHDRAFT_138226 [Guillardia theta CCMP2712]EKX46488.1 hypothetical protein GUITHDRAFT_138226 [Guillardia theta CCMP2712]|eukprot:XP_005833468.1 hypothetical protein GUITHDRAFT_138226 [Guillardia theta CCMP2712]
MSSRPAVNFVVFIATLCLAHDEQLQSTEGPLCCLDAPETCSPVSADRTTKISLPLHATTVKAGSYMVIHLGGETRGEEVLIRIDGREFVRLPGKPAITMTIPRSLTGEHLFHATRSEQEEGDPSAACVCACIGGAASPTAPERPSLLLLAPENGTILPPPSHLARMTSAGHALMLSFSFAGVSLGVGEHRAHVRVTTAGKDSSCSLSPPGVNELLLSPDEVEFDILQLMLQQACLTEGWRKVEIALVSWTGAVCNHSLPRAWSSNPLLLRSVWFQISSEAAWKATLNDERVEPKDSGGQAVARSSYRIQILHPHRLSCFSVREVPSPRHHRKSRTIPLVSLNSSKAVLNAPTMNFMLVLRSSPCLGDGRFSLFRIAVNDSIVGEVSSSCSLEIPLLVKEAGRCSIHISLLVLPRSAGSSQSFDQAAAELVADARTEVEMVSGVGKAADGSGMSGIVGGNQRRGSLYSSWDGLKTMAALAEVRITHPVHGSTFALPCRPGEVEHGGLTAVAELHNVAMGSGALHAVVRLDGRLVREGEEADARRMRWWSTRVVVTLPWRMLGIGSHYLSVSLVDEEGVEAPAAPPAIVGFRVDAVRWSREEGELEVCKRRAGEEGEAERQEGRVYQQRQLGTLEEQLEEYVRVHDGIMKLVLEGKAETSSYARILVYTPPDYGWGNRMLDLAACLLLAMVTDRALVVNWTRPFPLSHFIGNGLREEKGAARWGRGREIRSLVPRANVLVDLAVEENLQRLLVSGIHQPERVLSHADGPSLQSWAEEEEDAVVMPDLSRCLHQKKLSAACEEGLDTNSRVLSLYFSCSSWELLTALRSCSRFGLRSLPRIIYRHSRLSRSHVNVESEDEEESWMRGTRDSRSSARATAREGGRQREREEEEGMGLGGRESLDEILSPARGIKTWPCSSLSYLGAHARLSGDWDPSGEWGGGGQGGAE